MIMMIMMIMMILMIMMIITNNVNSMQGGPYAGSYKRGEDEVD